MKIFGLLVVKNEADIICHTLRAASEWCDEIYVLDNGSDDGTWPLVKEMAKRRTNIIAQGQSFEPFANPIRAQIFNEYRNRAQTGDWWCRLDSDELYVNSPRDFIKSSAYDYDVVWATHLQYYFTNVDFHAYENSPELYASSVPPKDRIRYYVANASETRFFRYRKRLKWEQDAAWPTHLGRVCPRRILVRHYQYRSPPQIQARIATRSTVAGKSSDFDHWVCDDWRSLIRDSSELHYNSGDGNFIINEGDLPEHQRLRVEGRNKEVYARIRFVAMSCRLVADVVNDSTRSFPDSPNCCV